MFSFNKIREKGRTDSAWKQGRGRDRGLGMGGEMNQTTYAAYVNKRIKKRNKKNRRAGL
jgi:hypothetical protein